LKNVCIRCGKTFEANNKLAKYCPECRRVVSLEQKRNARMKAYIKEKHTENGDSSLATVG